MRVPGMGYDATKVEGEEVEVAVAGRSSLRGYLARPVGGTERPAVMVLHEAFGLVEHTRDLARRFAGAGYIALAPDLYTRSGAPDADDMAAVFAAMLGLVDDEVVADIEACSGVLHGLEGSNGRVGVIGFCSGGRYALLAACQSDAIDAAVDCWGGFADRAGPDAVTTEERPVPVLELAEQLHVDLLVVGGSEDANPSPAVIAEILRLASASGRSVTAKVYADAGHAFLADYRTSYREGPAHELWDDVLAFFAPRLAITH